MTPLATHQSASAISRGINGQATHVTRYLARVDSFLDECKSDAAKRGFLGEQIKQRENKYIEFQQRVDAGEDVGDVSAFDYVEAIAGLEKRMWELG